MCGEQRLQWSDVLRLEVVLETMRLYDEELARGPGQDVEDRSDVVRDTEKASTMSYESAYDRRDR